MRNVLFKFETGFIGTEIEEEFHFFDETTDKQIEDEFNDWLADQMEQLNYGWEEI